MRKADPANSALAELEVLVRAGELAQVRKQINEVNRPSLSREELLAFAALANRVYEPRLAYRFLHSTVRSLTSMNPPSDAEKLEYAEALRGLGLIEEAIGLLQELDDKAMPAMNLRLGFCHMTRWQYFEAIPYLQKYIASADPSSYTTIIAKVNLAAAEVIIRNDGIAEIMLAALTRETKAAGHKLLHGNCLELTAQLSILQGKHEAAEAIFEEAEDSVTDSKTRYGIYMRKWKAISKCLRNNAVSEELLQCRQVAEKDGDYETVRECDLYIGYLSKDKALIEKVYFGTPFLPYRQRILSLLQQGEQNPEFFPEQFFWSPGSSSSTIATFDLLGGRFDGATERLEPGQLMHRMLILLAADFYRPLTAAGAFSELFPGEHFFQEGSINRVCQVVKRLRAWLQAQGGHLAIDESNGAYRLIARPGIAVRVPRDPLPRSPQGIAFLQFKFALNGAHSFTRNDVVHYLNCSPTGAARFIHWTLKIRHCETIGGGRNRRYRLAG